MCNIDTSIRITELYSPLHTEICHFQAKGKILLCGDFNAQTGSETNCIDHTGDKHIFKQSPLTPSPTAMRNNPDRLRRVSGLYVFSGRIRGDSLGRFTCCSAFGTSVVDYAISDTDPSSFSAFTVRAQTPLSDHSQINIYLRKHWRYCQETAQ